MSHLLLVPLGFLYIRDFLHLFVCLSVCTLYKIFRSTIYKYKVTLCRFIAIGTAKNNMRSRGNRTGHPWDGRPTLLPLRCRVRQKFSLETELMPCALKIYVIVVSPPPPLSLILLYIINTDNSGSGGRFDSP